MINVSSRRDQTTFPADGARAVNDPYLSRAEPVSCRPGTKPSSSARWPRSWMTYSGSLLGAVLSASNLISRNTERRIRAAVPCRYWITLAHRTRRGNMVVKSFPGIVNQAVGRPNVPQMRLCKAVAFAAGLGLSMLSHPLHAAPASGGDTVQGLYDALLSTMKNGRILGQSGRFAKLEPVICRSFDVAAMARLSVGPSWASLTEEQRQQMTESYGRYISAIYADRFDSYAGQKLEVTGELPATSGVIVKSQIIKANGE